MDYVEEGKKVILQEAEGLSGVAEKLDDDFRKAVDLLHNCKGRIIVVGMGKSGIIGRKIAATLASIGAPAFFLHPSEAVHGDLGIVTREDVAILLSKSGETDEIKCLLPNLKSLGIPTIGIVGDLESTLGKKCTVKLNISVPKEADPNNLAPTTSTTAMLGMGDALAMVLLKLKQLRPEDFALLHPAGSLGKRLTVKVGDLMRTGDDIPMVLPDTTVKNVLFRFTKTGMGVAAVVDEKNGLLGVFTDGDLRRLMEKDTDCLGMAISEVMKRDPKKVVDGGLAFDALKKMEESHITGLIVVDEKNAVVGIINIYDVLNAGIR
jgi:arabinose-5-phosphate isomerase